MSCLKQTNKTPSIRRSVDPSIRRSVDPSIRRSVDPSIRRSVDPSIRRSVDPSIRRSVDPSIRRSVDPSIRRSVDPSIRRSVDPSIRRSVDPSIRRSVDPSIRRSVDPSIRRSVDPSIRRSVDPSIRRSYYTIIDNCQQAADAENPQLLLLSRLVGFPLGRPETTFFSCKIHLKQRPALPIGKAAQLFVSPFFKSVNSGRTAALNYVFDSVPARMPASAVKAAQLSNTGVQYKFKADIFLTYNHST